MKRIVSLLLFLLASFTASAVQSVTLAWDPSQTTNVTEYFSYYGPSSGNYTNKQNAGNVTNYTVAGLKEGVTYYFVVTAYDEYGLESIPSNEVFYSVPLITTNRAPTLDPISDLHLTDGAGIQTVNLTGITSGATNEIQVLTVTASCNNTSLIPTLAVTYISPQTNGTLRFVANTNVLGNAVITVRVNDGGTTNNVTARSFTVTVRQPPYGPLNLKLTPVW